MQKDYKIFDTEQPEIGRIEDYWTDKWVESGGVRQVAPDYLSKLEEYPIVKPVLDRLNKGAVILDGGCGKGEWVVGLSRQGFKPIGVDISRKTIDELKEVFPDIRFERCDIRELPLDAQSVDAYISWGVFEHFEEGLQSCIKEAFRVLRPGGYLLISVPFHNKRHLKSASRWNNKSKEQEDLSGAQFYQWRLTKAELDFELTRAGFAVEDIHPVGYFEGLRRTLHHSLGFKYDSRIMNYTLRLGKFVFSRNYLSHMILAVSRKP